MPSQHPANQPAPVDPKLMPNAQSVPRQSQPPQPPRTSKPSGPGRKLDAGMKDQVYLLLARGHSLAAAARIIGVSDRTIRRERRRDPFFKRRLGEKGEKIADICFESLVAAAPTKPHLVPQLYKLVYPDRYYYRPDTIALKEHEASIAEAFSHFEAIASPEQMRELQRRLSGERKGREPR